MFSRVVAKALRCMVTDRCGGVEVIAGRNRLTIDGDSLRVEEVVLSSLNPKRPMEALAAGVAVDVPFA